MLKDMATPETLYNFSKSQKQPQQQPGARIHRTAVTTAGTATRRSSCNQTSEEEMDMAHYATEQMQYETLLLRKDCA